MRNTSRLSRTFCIVMLLTTAGVATAEVRVDLSAYRREAGIDVQQQGQRIRIEWPMDADDMGGMTLEPGGGLPLIAELSDRLKREDHPTTPIVKNLDPVFLLTVGTRDLHQASGWVAFFDDPPKRPHQTYRIARDTQNVRVVSEGRHTTIILDGLTAGPFKGDLRFTFYPGTRLVHTQAVISTAQDACAILYDAGLTSSAPGWRSTAFIDDHDQWHRIDAGNDEKATPQAVRFRTIIAESDAGSVAIFPPPHQYFYPLDFVDNFGFTWHGREFRNLVEGFGAGIRQPLEGDKRHVPWINAPPGTEQKLGVFYLLSAGKAEAAMEQVQRFTRGDRFKHLGGYQTFTSHYHVEHTKEFVAAQKAQNTDGIPKGLEEPGFVKMFKARGVDIAHLAEFHYDTSKEKLSRIELLKVMHDECRRLSNDQFLLLPGEEPDVHLGGHWISLFPKPIYWTLDRKKGQPFVEQMEGFGSIYHVGNSDDVLKLMETERGLMWTAHARIKGSFGFPDAYKNKDFFRSDCFLGAAWKAMPADHSLPRLGTRVLDLLDDISNWGLHKYTIGEVDVFAISPESELYGHMNINYVKLDKVPRFDDGWQPLLDSLRAGRLFVTTGEVLIPACTFAGKSGGETIHLPPDGKANLEASLEWTFPLSFAEIVSGDGEKVYRQRIELNDTEAFGSRTLKVPANLTGRKWVRFEVWDIATNGAFTEPVWIE